MVQILHLSVENPDELRNAGAFDTTALIRVQWSASQGGTYADISGTGSTPTIPIVAATRSYTAYDPAGTVSTWYRTRYENGAATRTSDWSASFQAGDETGGLICSIYDVEQELGKTLDANERETVIEKIRQVTVSIEGITQRWFVPRPLSGTATYRFTTSSLQRIRLSKGIRSITTLGIASTNQPPSGGTYSTAPATDYWLEPSDFDRDAGWPATSIVIAPGATYRLASVTFGAQVTGAFGWDAVPADIQGVAARAVVRRYIGKGGGGVSVAVGPAGTEFLLPDMSGADRDVIEFYRARAV